MVHGNKIVNILMFNKKYRFWRICSCILLLSFIYLVASGFSWVSNLLSKACNLFNTGESLIIINNIGGEKYKTSRVATTTILVLNKVAQKSYFLKINISFFIDLAGRVSANGPGDLDSIPGRVIPKTLKMVLDTSLLNTQQYKVRIEGKVEQYRERSSVLPYTSV